MTYEQFNLLKVKQTFGLSTGENVRVLPQVEPVAVSEFLHSYLKETLPLAATGSEKARSELIISPDYAAFWIGKLAYSQVRNSLLMRHWASMESEISWLAVPQNYWQSKQRPW